MRWTLNNFSGCLSGMRVEHLKGWLAEARKEKAAKVKVSEGSKAAIVGPGGGGDREEEG